MDAERLVDLLLSLAIIPIASMVNYFVMRRIVRQDVKKLILDRILEGEEAKEFQKLISTINRSLEGEELAKVKKGIMNLLEIDVEEESEDFPRFPVRSKEDTKTEGGED